MWWTYNKEEQSTLCVDNKKEQTELKATNIISLFHPNFFFGFLKKAGRHQKGAGRRALQKRPRQNTVYSKIINVGKGKVEM